MPGRTDYLKVHFFGIKGDKFDQRVIDTLDLSIDNPVVLMQKVYKVTKPTSPPSGGGTVIWKMGKLVTVPNDGDIVACPENLRLHLPLGGLDNQLNTGGHVGFWEFELI